MEDLGRSDTRVDDPTGRMMGDTCTDFILSVYQEYLWSADREYLTEMWPSVRKAIRWQVDRCGDLGLPSRLCNTYDWWEFEKKDLVSYNSFLHLAAMRASEKLATAVSDAALAQECARNFQAARHALHEKLWTGRFFRAWWMADGSHPEALHADTLYGQLWAFLLGLGWLTDPEKIRSHLAEEKSRNGGSRGLVVMRGAGRDEEFLSVPRRGAERARDDLIWEAGSIDWCSVSLFTGADVGGSLSMAETVIRKYSEILRDQWDYRDVSTSWDGEPWCNSHYGRQLILWAIPFALSGQQLDVPQGKMSFAPRAPAPARLPFATPRAIGFLNTDRKGNAELEIIDGELEVRQPLMLPAGSAIPVRRA
jgi:uncharacterized protein (DUF608 family)